MDLTQAFASDLGLMLFAAAGLVATTVAILADTRTQAHAADLAQEAVRIQR